MLQFVLTAGGDLGDVYLIIEDADTLGGRIYESLMCESVSQDIDMVKLIIGKICGYFWHAGKKAIITNSAGHKEE